MNRVGWIIFAAVAVLVLGGLVVWARTVNPPLDVSSIENNSIIAASSQNGEIADHAKGSDANKILLVEYGDLQCPSCGAAHPNVEKLMEEYNDDVTFVFRNFPLTQIHPNARVAAAVAEAAGLQGKYWEMHDMLFEHQNDWSSTDAKQRTTVFEGYARTLELNIDQYNQDLVSERVGKKINFDMALGRKAGASATPTFFLNGEKLDTASANGIVQGDLSGIKAKLDALISKGE